MTPLPTLNRRDFNGRVLRCLLTAAGVGAAAGYLWDRKGPGSETATSVRDGLPDFRLADDSGPGLVVAHGNNRDLMARRGLAALGGMQRFVSPGDRVAIKVNAAFAAAPSVGATTHPDLLAAVVQMCRNAGAADIVVLDNPINDPAACFYLSGLEAAARDNGARIVLPSPRRFESVSLRGGRLIRSWPVMTEPLLAADKLIGLAPVKDHHRSGASMTLKNWYGLLGGRRNIFHQHIHTIIAELAMMVRPTLVILDGTRTMVQNGPTGGSLNDLADTETLMAGIDPVAVDTVGAKLLNKNVADLPYLSMAARAGLGTTDTENPAPVHVNTERT